MTCGDCKFSDMVVGVGDSDEPMPGLACRRFPPQSFSGHSAWPMVGGDDWCGEWQEKPVEPPTHISRERG